jgi:hypothetical protein
VGRLKAGGVKVENETVVLVVAVAVVAVAVIYIGKKASAAIAGTTPASLGEAAGAGIVNAGGGVVLGVGDAVGIPRTDADLCAQAKAAGNTWDASKYCPAGDFLSYVFSPTPAPVINQQNPQLPVNFGVTGSW